MTHLKTDTFLEKYAPFLIFCELKPKDYQGEIVPRNDKERARWLKAWEVLYENWVASLEE